MTHFRLKEGPLTVARFDGGPWRVLPGCWREPLDPRTETLNNYVWMEVDEWPRWERTLMEAVHPSHRDGLRRFGRALLEACRFVPGLKPVALDARLPPSMAAGYARRRAPRENTRSPSVSNLGLQALAPLLRLLLAREERAGSGSQ